MSTPTSENEARLSLPELLGGWMLHQRWYADKGRGVPRLDRLGGLLLREAGPEQVGVEVFFVAATPPGTEGWDGDVVTYQVPLTYRSEPEPDLADALIGVVDDPARGRQWIYDAPHDPVFVSAWLELLRNGITVTAAEGAEHGQAFGVPYGDVRPLPAGPARVLVGEQSNTSIIVGATSGDGRERDEGSTAPVIVKLFRVLQAGANPDVSIQTVLAAAGCERVPHPVGAWEGNWTSPHGTPQNGHLGYACEFVERARKARPSPPRPTTWARRPPTCTPRWRRHCRPSRWTASAWSRCRPR
jgi:hypothetical protein